jgi:hypothetical protein
VIAYGPLVDGFNNPFLTGWAVSWVYLPISQSWTYYNSNPKWYITGWQVPADLWTNNWSRISPADTTSWLWLNVWRWNTVLWVASSIIWTISDTTADYSYIMWLDSHNTAQRTMSLWWYLNNNTSYKIVIGKYNANYTSWVFEVWYGTNGSPANFLTTFQDGSTWLNAKDMNWVPYSTGAGGTGGWITWTGTNWLLCLWSGAGVVCNTTPTSGGAEVDPIWNAASGNYLKLKWEYTFTWANPTYWYWLKIVWSWFTQYWLMGWLEYATWSISPTAWVYWYSYIPSNNGSYWVYWDITNWNWNNNSAGWYFTDSYISNNTWVNSNAIRISRHDDFGSTAYSYAPVFYLEDTTTGTWDLVQINRSWTKFKIDSTWDTYIYGNLRDANWVNYITGLTTSTWTLTRDNYSPLSSMNSSPYFWQEVGITNQGIDSVQFYIVDNGWATTGGFINYTVYNNTGKSTNYCFANVAVTGWFTQADTRAYFTNCSLSAGNYYIEATFTGITTANIFERYYNPWIYTWYNSLKFNMDYSSVTVGMKLWEKVSTTVVTSDWSTGNKLCIFTGDGSIYGSSSFYTSPQYGLVHFTTVWTGESALFYNYYTGTINYNAYWQVTFVRNATAASFERYNVGWQSSEWLSPIVKIMNASLTNYSGWYTDTSPVLQVKQSSFWLGDIFQAVKNNVLQLWVDGTGDTHVARGIDFGANTDTCTGGVVWTIMFSGDNFYGCTLASGRTILN